MFNSPYYFSCVLGTNHIITTDQKCLKTDCIKLINYICLTTIFTSTCKTSWIQYTSYNTEKFNNTSVTCSGSEIHIRRFTVEIIKDGLLSYVTDTYIYSNKILCWSCPFYFQEFHFQKIHMTDYFKTLHGLQNSVYLSEHCKIKSLK